MPRATFLAVLAELDSILITALNANSTASSLFRVSFDAAQAGENSRLPIEQCACPAGYSGLSCERCLAGFYRLNGVCVPCMCNGRSSTCEDNTGICNVSLPEVVYVFGCFSEFRFQKCVLNLTTTLEDLNGTQCVSTVHHTMTPELQILA